MVEAYVFIVATEMERKEQKLDFNPSVFRPNHPVDSINIEATLIAQIPWIITPTCQCQSHFPHSFMVYPKGALICSCPSASASPQMLAGRQWRLSVSQPQFVLFMKTYNITVKHTLMKSFFRVVDNIDSFNQMGHFFKEHTFSVYSMVCHVQDSTRHTDHTQSPS